MKSKNTECPKFPRSPKACPNVSLRNKVTDFVSNYFQIVSDLLNSKKILSVPNFLSVMSQEAKACPDVCLSKKLTTLQVNFSLWVL